MRVHHRPSRLYVPIAFLVGGFALSLCMLLGGPIIPLMAWSDEGSQVGIDNFAGIKETARVEDSLDLAKDWIERPVLPGYPGGARQAGPMLRADGALEIEREGMDLFGNGGESRNMFGIL